MDSGREKERGSEERCGAKRDSRIKEGNLKR